MSDAAREDTKRIALGVDSPFFSTIVLSKNRRFPRRVSRKKDPWKEWKWKVPLELHHIALELAKGAEPGKGAKRLDVLRGGSAFARGFKELLQLGIDWATLP